MGTVIFIRHGDVPKPACGTWQDANWDPGLNHKGRLEAAAAANKLYELIASRIEEIVCVPGVRFIETARILCLRQPGSTRISPNRHLRDQSFAGWEGKPIQEIARLHRIQKPPQGDAWPNFKERVVSAVENLCQWTDPCVIVGSGLLWAALSEHHGHDQKFVKNCEIVQITFGDSGAVAFTHAFQPPPITPARPQTDPSSVLPKAEN